MLLSWKRLVALSHSFAPHIRRDGVVTHNKPTALNTLLHLCTQKREEGESFSSALEIIIISQCILKESGCWLLIIGHSLLALNIEPEIENVCRTLIITLWCRREVNSL